MLRSATALKAVADMAVLNNTVRPHGLICNYLGGATGRAEPHGLLPHGVLRHAEVQQRGVVQWCTGVPWVLQYPGYTRTPHVPHRLLYLSRAHHTVRQQPVGLSVALREASQLIIP